MHFSLVDFLVFGISKNPNIKNIRRQELEKFVMIRLPVTPRILAKVYRIGHW